MSIQNYDLLVVGSGFAGSVVAYLAATKLQKKVLLLERRNHIAGNMYDETDKQSGILVQRYGPHSFHTNNERVHDFITSVGKWYPFYLQGSVDIDGISTPSPFNYSTIDTFFSEEMAARIKSQLERAFPGQKKATILELLKSTDQTIQEYANFLFEKDYKPYTIKQWGIKPSELDVSVLERVPVRLDYTDQYFDDKYQLLPKNGFTHFFTKMLSHPNIEIRLNTDARNFISLCYNSKKVLHEGKPLNIPVLYTGPLDELLHYEFGRLPYRSLYFEYRIYNIASFQRTPGVAYPFANGYTRITEYTKLPPQPGLTNTLVAYEYPVEYGSPQGILPYYPILTNDSQKTYKSYVQKLKSIENLYVCGRLADYKYYNMDNVIERAMEVFKTITF